MNGYNFTEQVRSTLAQSRQEAVDLGHEYVGPEHILLAISRATEGPAVAMLSQLGVETAAVRREVANRLSESRAVLTGPDLPFTASGKRVIELAMYQAAQMHHTYVGTEHLLLGLINEQKSIAAQALNALGVTLEAARGQTLHLLPQDRPLAAGPTTHRLATFLHGLGADATPATFFARLIQIDGGAHHLLETLGVDVAALEWEIAQHEWTGGSIPDLLTAAQAEKRALHDPATGTQHVLLAFLALHPEHAYRALNERDVTYANARMLAEKIFG
jgi:ATP-dependent Clp protease ATP-binding subunit ClpA